jgi:uncharacterized membrane protein YkoI
VLVSGCAGLAFAAPPAASSAQAVASAATPRITEEQATAIALKVMPGKATGVTIERKRGKNVYVVEIMTASQGEKDVFVDMVSGKVLGTD